MQARQHAMPSCARLFRFPERRYEVVCTAEFICSTTVTGAGDVGGKDSPSEEMSL
jgi:hypothetical protein